MKRRSLKKFISDFRKQTHPKIRDLIPEEEIAMRYNDPFWNTDL